MGLRSAFVIAALGAACLGSAAHAARIDAAVPANAYITQSGLDWAWADPLPGADLTYQSAFGWRLPTAAEMTHAPLATDFLFPGANVPFNGTDPVSHDVFDDTNADYTGDGACAAAYFSAYTWCDWINGHGDFAGAPGASGTADQLVVRTVAVTTTPIPATLPLLASALGGLGFTGWRRRKSAQPA